MRTVIILWVLLLTAITPALPATSDAPVPKHPMAREHEITIDATALKPPKPWSIPGITEPLQSLNGPMTNKVTTLNLRPGRYMFTTTIIAFSFTVDLEGRIDYSKMHDQCVNGRGTSHLTVTCRYMMPQ